jgi:hypothetical protein
MVEQPMETLNQLFKRTVEEPVINIPVEPQIIEETTKTQPVQEIVSPAVAQSIWKTSEEL